jgi:hypothetical protein
VRALGEFKTTRRAAQSLGISQSALIKKAFKYNIRYDKNWYSDE